jgi:hypothetical protein
MWLYVLDPLTQYAEEYVEKRRLQMIFNHRQSRWGGRFCWNFGTYLLEYMASHQQDIYLYECQIVCLTEKGRE